MRLIMLFIGLFTAIAGAGILAEYGVSFIGVCIFLMGVLGIIGPLVYDEEEWLA